MNEGRKEGRRGGMLEKGSSYSQLNAEGWFVTVEGMQPS